MTIEIKSNGRPFGETAATTVREALDEVIAKGATLVRVDVERVNYLTAFVTIRGTSCHLTFAQVSEAPAPSPASARDANLATPKQIALLNKFGHGTFPGMTKSYASACIADILANR